MEPLLGLVGRSKPAEVHVRLAGVSRRYGSVEALRSLSLDIPRGEWLAVMGPSGSGKTTLLNLLGGLDRADEGRIEVDGIDLSRMDDDERTRFRREHVGIVFQQFHLLPYLTALENVMVAQHYHSMADEVEAHEALARVGLAHRAHARPAQLSGGEQQRISIARALINEPKLLLADEPTGNLDEENARAVLEIVAELHREGQTVVLVTHDPEVGALADRRVELHHGRLTDVSLLSAELAERLDHFLEGMWYLWEEGQEIALEAVRVHDVVDNERTARDVIERGWVLRDRDRLGFTEKGVQRARDLVRRHRLAECLFATALNLQDPNLNQTACRIEHILDPEVTDGICGFLSHPQACPHGKTIPSGPCCPNGSLHFGPPVAKAS